MPTQLSPCASVPSLSEAIALFLGFARVELQFAPQSLAKYDDCLRQVRRMIGDRPVTDIQTGEILKIKSAMLARGNGVCRQIVILAATKRFLSYCRDHLGLNVLDPNAIRIPRRPRREVTFLTADEVERFVDAIPLLTGRDQPHLLGIRFRALVEMLLGSAMRIGELLSLNRSDVDFERKEAKVIGKGNKQRVVFFTERALHWLHRYLNSRTDDAAPLFVSQHNDTRLSRADIWRPFARCRKLAGLNKPVRPHLLRHTAATQLLFNGCPIGHIKEILGHERLETTCRYYLGLDRRAAKLAHEQYLVYEATGPHPAQQAVGTYRRAWQDGTGEVFLPATRMHSGHTGGSGVRVAEKLDAAFGGTLAANKKSLPDGKAFNGSNLALRRSA